MAISNFSSRPIHVIDRGASGFRKADISARYKTGVLRRALRSRIAVDWGWLVDDIARRRTEESSKARDNGAANAHNTAERAAEAAECNVPRASETQLQ